MKNSKDLLFGMLIGVIMALGILAVSALPLVASYYIFTYTTLAKDI